MSIATMLLLVVSFTNAQEKHKMVHSKKNMDNMKMNKTKDVKAEAILTDYFMLKDALVADEIASQMGIPKGDIPQGEIPKSGFFVSKGGLSGNNEPKYD